MVNQIYFYCRNCTSSQVRIYGISKDLSYSTDNYTRYIVSQSANTIVTSIAAHNPNFIDIGQELAEL